MSKHVAKDAKNLMGLSANGWRVSSEGDERVRLHISLFRRSRWHRIPLEQVGGRESCPKHAPGRSSSGSSCHESLRACPWAFLR